MADFATAHAPVKAVEGKYSNRGSDRGGETLCGVSRRAWPSWKIWQYVDRCKTLPGFPDNLDYKGLEPHLIAFYRRNFWMPIRGDDIPSQRVANVLYDMAVNSGIRPAVIRLQESLNLMNRGGKDYPDLDPDGVMGSGTISALKAYLTKRDERALVVVLVAKHVLLWMDLAESDQSQEANMNGWMNRAVTQLRANI